MKKVFKFCTRHEFLIAVMILVAFFRIPSLFEPNWYGDEGIYLALGQALKHGLVWYRDIHDNKPPLLYLLAAASGSVMYFRTLLLVWMTATLAVFDRLSRRIIEGRNRQRAALVIFAVLTTLPAIEGNIANAEIFMILPTLLGVCFLLSENKGRKKVFDYFLSGLFFSLALLFKVPAIFEFAGIGFFFFVFNKKRIVDVFKGIFSWEFLFLMAGFAAPIFLTVIYYLSKGALGAYFTSAFSQNLGYLASWKTGHFTQGIGTGSGLLPRGLLLMGFSVLLWLVNRKGNRHFNMVWIWFGFSLFAVLLSERPYPHYLIQLVASGSLLLAMASYEKTKEWALLCLAVGLLGTATIKYRFYFYPVGPYYLNFVSLISGKISNEKYNDYFDWRVNRTNRMTGYIRRITDPSEKIFVWGDEPFDYVQSNRLPIGKYVVAYHIVDFGAMDETAKLLASEKPKIIITSDRESRDFVQLKQILADSYTLVKRFDDAKVYFHFDFK